jgi:hypothetical protein
MNDYIVHIFRSTYLSNIPADAQRCVSLWRVTLCMLLNDSFDATDIDSNAILQRNDYGNDIASNSDGSFVRRRLISGSGGVSVDGHFMEVEKEGNPRTTATVSIILFIFIILLFLWLSCCIWFIGYSGYVKNEIKPFRCGFVHAAN